MLGEETGAKLDAAREEASGTRQAPAELHVIGMTETRQFKSGELPAHEVRRKIQWLGLPCTERRPFPWMAAVFTVTGPRRMLDELQARLHAAAWDWWE